jgi:hypothetical protein
VFGCGDRRIADHTCSATTLRRPRDEWISAGVAEPLRLAVLAAYDRMLGLELEQLAVDSCTTKAPCGGQTAGPTPDDRRIQGRKHLVATEAGIPLGVVPAPANHRDDGLLAASLDTIPVVGPLPERPVVHWTPATTTSPAGRPWPTVGWHGRPDRHPRSASAEPGGSPLGDPADPRLGQPGRQAALVDRAAPTGGGVLAGVGQRRHGLR